MSTRLLTQRLFPLGSIVATPGALAACSQAHLVAFLTRHVSGDWGVVCPEDHAANDSAIRRGSRLLSAYPIDPRQPSEGHGANTL